MNDRQMLAELLKQERRLRLTPIVDDDFPSVKCDHDMAVRQAEEHLARPQAIPSLNELAKEINAINLNNGWEVVRPQEWTTNKYKIPAILALIHSEASEALEAFRKDDMENFAEELADVIIRCLDCAGGMGFDMDKVVDAKLEKNRGRGYKHGGKRI